VRIGRLAPGNKLAISRRLDLVWVITRRTFLKNALLTAGLARAIPTRWRKRRSPHRGEFRGAGGRVRLPRACLRSEHFAYSPARVYTPESATLEELQALHRALHVERTIVVQRACMARTMPACSAPWASSATAPGAWL